MMLIFLHTIFGFAQTTPKGDALADMKFIRAVEANPEDVKAHQAYLKSVGHNPAKFEPQYSIMHG